MVARKTRAPVKRRRMFKRSRVRRPIYSKPSSNNFMTVQRKFYVGSWTPGTASTSDFWRYVTVSLAVLPSVAEFTSLFDSYRIKSFMYEYRPRYDGFDGSNTTDVVPPGITNQSGCMMHVMIDPRSHTVPSGVYNSTTINSFLENGKVKSFNLNKPVKVLVKYPMIQHQGGVGALNQRILAPWIQTDSTSTSHYGFHVFMSDVNMTGSFGQTVDIFVTLNLQFKAQK